MVEFLDKREKDAISVGFSDFWERSLRDLILYEKAYEKKEKEKLRIRTRLLYDECMLTGDIIGKMLSGKGKIPRIEELYPMLFDDIEQEPITAENDIELQRKVAGFKALTQVYNLQHKKNGGINNDTARTENKDFSGNLQV